MMLNLFQSETETGLRDLDENEINNNNTTNPIESVFIWYKILNEHAIILYRLMCSIF